jgi:hypothetical protein
VSILAEIGISSEQAITALVSAGSTAVVAMVVAALKTPGELRQLRKELDDYVKREEHKTRRIFRKIRRIENILIDDQIRQGNDLIGLHAEMRSDQRDEADARDMNE